MSQWKLKNESRQQAHSCDQSALQKKMVLFINLPGIGLTQEINRDGGSISWAPILLLSRRYVEENWCFATRTCVTSPWKNIGTVLLMPPNWSHRQKCDVAHQDTVRWDWIYGNFYTTTRLWSSMHKNRHSKDRCLDLWWKTTFHCEITKRDIKRKERKVGAVVKALPSTSVARSI